MRAKSTSYGSGARPWFPIAAILLILLLAPMVAYGQTADTVVVRWTAPGDDGAVGTAAQYDLRVSESPITEANFDQAIPVTGLPAPGPAGTRHAITVRGLSRDRSYYFAIKTSDDAGNRASISNIARWDWIIDTAPPSAPSGLSAAIEGSSVRVSWAANTEPDLAGYNVYRDPDGSGTYELLNVAGLVTTNEFVDANVPEGAKVVSYRITALDANHNESGRSAIVTASFNTQQAATQTRVEEGYPNPSTMSSPVHIPVVVPANGATNAYVEILDSGTRRVRRIDVGDLSAGRAEIVWDGKNDAGQMCAPGVYRGWFITDKDRHTIRIVRVP